MKDKRNVINILQNADDETIERIVKDYPQADSKKADRIFRQVERRVQNSDGDFTADEVSGVERRSDRRVFRRVVSAAACLAIVAAGTGTAYALRRNAPDNEKLPAAEVTEEVSSDMAAPASRTVPENIDKDYIIDLCSNARSNYSALSISYTNTISSDYDHIYKGSLQIDNRADTFWSQEKVDILRKGESIGKYDGFMFANGTNRVFRIADNARMYQVDNNYSGSNSMFYCPESWVNEWLSTENDWSVAETTTFSGRECIVITGIESNDISFCMWIDAETGVPLRFTQKGQYYAMFEVNSITYNDNTGFMTKENFKEFLKDYEPAEDGYDLSFLDESSNSGNTDIPGEITQEWLYELCTNPENNFTRCYMETNENGMRVTKAVDNKKGIKYYTTDNSGRIDYVYGGKRISIFEQSKEVIENPVESMKSISYDGSLNDLSKWTIEGREKYLGRDCAVIRVAGNPVSSQLEEAFDTQRYIDLETGITLRIGVYDADGIQYTVETSRFFVDDDATMVPDPINIIYMIDEGGYTVEDGLDLSFLFDDTASATADFSVTPKTTESVTETIPPPTSGISDEPAAQTDIFTMLDALDYHAISCDGLPTHKLTAPDGTVYLLHLDENSAYQYVWRRPSLIADDDNEAPLTAEIIEELYAHWNELNIVEL